MLAPLLQLGVLNAVEIHKALVDGVTEISRCLLADDADHAACQLAVQLVVAAENRYLLEGTDGAVSAKTNSFDLCRVVTEVGRMPNCWAN